MVKIVKTNNKTHTPAPVSTIESLASAIGALQDILSGQAAHAINLLLTCRNWLIGYYIVEYEQQGEDRAQYGDQLLKNLAKKLHRTSLSERRLREARQFYQSYICLYEQVFGYMQSHTDAEIWRTLSAELKPIEAEQIEKWRTASAELPAWAMPSERLFRCINYSSLQLLSTLTDPLKRAFYEQELIRGCWTYRELDRQISSLYFERMAISKDPSKLAAYVEKGPAALPPTETIKNPIVMEFMGIENVSDVTESALETAILNYLQQFLMELGQGFCFERRQKRVLIDEDYFKADLIFYNRILKCHYIIDLKIDRYRHEYGSQMNTYLNYYKENVKMPDDNDPVGLLLCTDYGEALVKYSLGGMSEQIFVSKYQLHLPTEEEIHQRILQHFSVAELRAAEEEEQKKNKKKNK